MAVFILFFAFLGHQTYNLLIVGIRDVMLKSLNYRIIGAKAEIFKKGIKSPKVRRNQDTHNNKIII